MYPFGLIFKLSAEKSRGGLNKLHFNRLGRAVDLKGSERRDTANNVPLADNWHRTAHKMASAVGGDSRFGVTLAVDIERSSFHRALKLVGEPLVHIFLFGYARGCHHTVAIADHDHKLTGFVERLGILRGKRRQLAYGGVFLEYHLSVAIGKDLKRISFTDNIDTDRTLLFRYA